MKEIKLYTKEEFLNNEHVYSLIVEPVHIDNEGNFEVFTLGNNKTIQQSLGFTFYIDETIKNEVYKFQVYMDGFTPKLRVRNGEEIIPEIIPEEILLIRQKEQEILELTQQLDKKLEDNFLS